MKHFIEQSAIGEKPNPTHFNEEILPELESLYAVLRPELAKSNNFIYLASTNRGEGSSTIAWALAYYIAMRENQDCLFVDGDIKHPVIRVDDSMPELGLSEYLFSDIDFKLLPFKTELQNLSAIHSGNIKGSYVHLSDQKSDNFIEEASRFYRTVIFNSAPGFSKYAEMWGKRSDALLVVSQYRSTKRQILERMLLGFKQADIPVTGIILNKIIFPVPDFLYRRL
ncbi:MAG: CpsD/CapB family tyrosine-protein kinase [bacterium]|nr:CpsD/CapB family tyrosine-protein kinase [bacterium]